MGVRASGFGFMVKSLRVSGLGFGVKGLGSEAWDSWFEDSGFGV